MIPCPYCGGTPILRYFHADLSYYKEAFYRVTCESCGASTSDHLTKRHTMGLWDSGMICNMSVMEERQVKRYIEIDGRKVNVKSCRTCPCYSEVDKDGEGPWCRHPANCAMPMEGQRYGKYCPLREVDG